MHTKFRALSLSHKTAPVQIRELISLDEGSIHSILLKLKEFLAWVMRSSYLPATGLRFIIVMNLTLVLKSSNWSDLKKA